jgi:predicted flap endonuclease-1-like 5' DNA nuclease
MNKQEAPASAYHIKNLGTATPSIKLAVPSLALTFLIPMSITLAVPAFPPAQLLHEILNFSPIGLSFWGISATTILSGVTNGLFWALIAAAVYGIARRPRKYESLSTMPSAPHLSTPPIAPQTVEVRAIPISPFFAAKEAQAPTKKDTDIIQDKRMEERPVKEAKLEEDPQFEDGVDLIEGMNPSCIQLLRKDTGLIECMRMEEAELDEDLQVEDGVEMIEGMDPSCAQLLRNAGITTIKDLLRVCATEPERKRLAKEVGVTYATLERWVCRGDLLRIRGIGRKYSAALESIGVKTVTDLSTRNPRNLWQSLRTMCWTTNLVAKIPTLKTIEIWVQKAKNCSSIEVWVQNSKELDITI